MPLTIVQVKSAQRRTIRLTTLFVVFVCISLLAIDAWLAWRAREQQLRQAIVANTNVASALAHQMDGMFSEVGRVLDSIAFELELDRMDNRALKHLQPILKNHVDSNKYIQGAFIYDAQGAWLISSQSATPAGLNNADRAYFIHHRDNSSRAIFIGQPIISRSSGVWIVPVSRRLNDAVGKFAGVVLITIELTHVSQMLSTLEIGRRGALNVMQADTAILVRRPFSIDSLGKTMKEGATKQLLLSKLSGDYEIVSPIDGVERVASFQHLRNHPLIVTVALSKSEMLQDWRETTWIQTLWITLLCLITGLAGIFVIRSVRHRIKVEVDLSQTKDNLTKANERLAQLASHDALTGLANRRAFDENLERNFAESCRSKQPLSLVMIDVDNFKQYNDFHGHQGGDRCLQQVAESIRSSARRPMDFAARYGGEEMAMILPNTDVQGAMVVAEMARSAVEALRILHSTQLDKHVSVSVGVACHTATNDIHDVQTLIQRADKALYQAKAAGRNQVAIDKEEEPSITIANYK